MYPRLRCAYGNSDSSCAIASRVEHVHGHEKRVVSLFSSIRNAQMDDSANECLPERSLTRLPASRTVQSSPFSRAFPAFHIHDPTLRHCDAHMMLKSPTVCGWHSRIAIKRELVRAGRRHKVKYVYVLRRGVGNRSRRGIGRAEDRQEHRPRNLRDRDGGLMMRQWGRGDEEMRR